MDALGTERQVAQDAGLHKHPDATSSTQRIKVNLAGSPTALCADCGVLWPEDTWDGSLVGGDCALPIHFPAAYLIELERRIAA
jgi:hypothetical protein